MDSTHLVAASAGTRRSAALDEVIASASIRSVYQPIVDLADGEVVAYEALARGPVGHLLELPDDLFAAAAEAGRIADLDEACMRSALERSSDRMPVDLPLFVNVEPSTLDSDLIRRTAPIPAAGGRPIVLEITERAITRSPHALLSGVATAREHGWRIALDDVGVEPGSLALLPIIRPEVVKLDMGLIRDEPDIELGRTMAAVMAYAERSGATILAEGIETDEHLDRALSLGATLGQGYRFGRPGDLPAVAPRSARRVLPGFTRQRPIALSPFDAVAATGAVARTATKRILLQISHHIEEQAGADPGGPLILSAFQDSRHFTPATARRYEQLVSNCSIVGALGIGMDLEPVPGVRGARLLPGDPLTDEWSVVVLGPHYCGALLGKDLDETHTGDADRRFTYVVTHDRALVELAAESLLRRVIAI
jgi:EAL domain-containing protein (putative c-di-GMP-specific phosphodiesterase class I)